MWLAWLVWLATQGSAGELLALREQLSNDNGGGGWISFELRDPAEQARARAAALASPEDIPALHRLLRKDGDPASAALLAMIGDRRAVGPIRRWFIQGDGFYGWESCVPMEIDSANWPAHMIYTDALLLLTGHTPLEQIHPTVPQIGAMEKDGRTYALSLFAPDRALRLFAARFRSEDRIFAVAAVADLIPMGLSRTEAEELLGPADMAPPDARTLRWNLGEELCGRRALDLRFDQGRLQQAAMVQLDDVPSEPAPATDPAPAPAPAPAPISP